MTKRLVLDGDGNIMNAIVIEPAEVDEWCAATGCLLAPVGVNGEIGGTYSNGVYTPPPEPEE